MKDALKEYRRKRNFRKTAEPKGGRRKSRVPLFVVQKHEARALHYDFRLEVDGVLKSWAVPKGPSMDPKQRRLAVLVEDHPMDYADFEGNIPEGEYGAGTVMVWDKGVYLDLRKARHGKPMDESLEEGKVEIWLEGTKLKGGFALIRTKIGWLLMKMDDEEARPGKDILAKKKSALSGRTMAQIRKG